MTDGRPAVYTIPAGSAFVDALAAGLLARHGDDPLSLARLTLLLPTRRAARAMRDGFLSASHGKPLLLPRFGALGDVDEDQELAAGGAEASLAETLPPAIPSLRRRLLLTQLVEKHAGVSPAAATQLAAELARLLDQLHTEEVPLSALADLVPADLAAHWQVIVNFLKMLEQPWDDILDIEGAIDPAARRVAALHDLARRWTETPPPHPVIAAGSTGSQPATAALLATIARLPDGAVVLPGLDQDLDDASWRQLGPEHPQFGLKQLLDRLEIDRADVTPWPGTTPEAGPRAILLREALRPAETTEAWADLPRLAPDTLDGLARVDCPDPQAEAGAIALLMRKALADGVGRCALVTPDRALARRVTAALARWDIDVDDSAGRPLKQTAPGALLCLVAEMIAAEAAPVPLLAVLNHPLVQAGRTPEVFGPAVRKLEKDRLRGPRPAAGFDALKHDNPAVALLVAELGEATAPLAGMMQGRHLLTDLIAAHVALAEWLSRDADGRVRLWDGEAGEQAAEFVASLRQSAVALPPQPGHEYAGLFAMLIADEVIRPRAGAGGPLAIWGPLEARLQHADLLILGGLNEDTWPTTGRHDPWLSRPMRARLGLPTPERRIGQQAHDFAQLASAANVVLTRAQKVDGAPTVASRWLLRMDQLLRASDLAWDRQLPADLLDWHLRLSQPETVEPVKPPEPRPPVAARPTRLSVTRIETWLRNPYAIFASEILRLKPLDPLDQDPGAAERGTAVHDALAKFVAAHPDALPEDAMDELRRLGEIAFDDLLERPGFKAFWWPWFERAMARFLTLEAERRAAFRPLATEVKGSLDVAGFELAAKADRIDGNDDAVELIDYKTGSVPSNKDIAAGLSPQLPLEVAIARAGGFANVPAAREVSAANWPIQPRADRLRPLKDVEQLADEALDGLRALVKEFAKPDTPYLACPRPDAAPSYNDYDLLARQPEWSAGDS